MIRIAFFSFIILMLPANAHAFRLIPMVLELDPEGDASSNAFTLENTDGETLAIQLSLHDRVVDEKGNETRPPAKDLTLFPTQVTLKPGEKKSVRIAWVGAKQIKQELAFRLIATQLPVSFQKKTKKTKGAALKFLLEYVASVYVVPSGASSKIELASLNATKDHKLQFTLKNSGNAHKVLTDFGLELKASNQKLQLTKELQEIRSENILAGQQRKFQIEIPASFPTANIQGEILSQP